MFKVGDKVYCSDLEQEGVVSCTSFDGSDFPIRVDFDGDNRYYYTHDGRLYLGQEICLHHADKKPVLKEEKSMFEVGDKVYCSGAKLAGIVVQVRTDRTPYPVCVSFPDGGCIYYTEDGRSNIWQTTPTLVVTAKKPSSAEAPQIVKPVVNQVATILGYQLDELQQIINYAISHGYKKKVLVTIEEIKKRGECEIRHRASKVPYSVKIKALSLDGKQVFDSAGDSYDDEDLTLYTFVEE